MKENKLKSMAENNKFEELMKNKQELERLSNITDISEVLDILNKYGYNGTKQDLESDLFEILQGLSEEDLQNISGGKILNKKYLAGLMGGLTMMGSMGLKTSAQEGNHSNVQPKSETSFLNKIDKTTMSIVGGSFAVGGIFVEALNLMFRKPKIESREKVVEEKVIEEEIIKDTDFALNEKQKKIYDNTKKLSEMILKYVKEYTEQHKKLPSPKLTTEKEEHRSILGNIRQIRQDWLDVYDNKAERALPAEYKTEILENRELWKKGNSIYPVEIATYAIENLFYGLPVGKTKMGGNSMPDSPQDCAEHMNFLKLLYELEYGYRCDFLQLQLKNCAGLSI